MASHTLASLGIGSEGLGDSEILDSEGLDSKGLDSEGLDSRGVGSAVSEGARASAEQPLAGSAEQDDEEVLEVEPEPLGEEDLPPNGFHAFLRHANLHNLLQIESLSRTTGVFLVVSGGSRGYLHLAGGELVHAETGGLSGEAAAAEILSWEDGEFKSCTRTLAPIRTVHSSVQTLLMRLAKASDEAAHAGRRHQSSRVVRRPLDQDAPTQPHLPPTLSKEGTPEQSEAAVGNAPASPAPRASRPPPLPARFGGDGKSELSSAAKPDSNVDSRRDSNGDSNGDSKSDSKSDSKTVADVVLSIAGEVISSRGAATEELSARVAYAARLADLIGRAIRSGTPRSLELRGKTTQTLVQWQADGTLTASLDLVQNSRR
jgi:hypothetical protein